MFLLLIWIVYRYPIQQNIRKFNTGDFRNTALLSNREIFMRALLIGAANIIIVHNHPSGSILPSGQDRDVCKRIMNAAKLLEIPLDDFIIIGSGEYYSFRKENELL